MIGMFLLGCVAGAVLVLLLTFIAAGFNVWRAGWREGTQLQGEGMERNKRREQP